MDNYIHNEYISKEECIRLDGYYSVAFNKGEELLHRKKPNPYTEGSPEYTWWEQGVVEHVSEGKSKWDRMLEGE